MTMYVITHKKFIQNYPQGYRSLLVGAENKLGDFTGYLKDNTGDNISLKNPNYCELTGLYWLWKNSSDNNIGISHYRRYFTKKSNNELLKSQDDVSEKIINLDDLDNLLKENDWIIPKKLDMGYYHFHRLTVYKQYTTYHNVRDLMTTRDIIKKLYPEYVKDFDKVMHEYSISPYNMFYTKKSKFDLYCKWLFDILFEVERNIDISDYDSYQGRVYGFLSERLFNVYLEHNKSKFKVSELNVFNTEKSNNLISNLHYRITHAIRWH